MCRLLLIKDKKLFEVVEYLREFARIAKNAKYNQGDGWGFCYLNSDNIWINYKNVNPIWEDDLSKFKDIKTNCLISHVRDAVNLETINVENNMPFLNEKGDLVFAFNGRLKGAKMKVKGNTGAHKIFNIIQDKIDEYGFVDGFKKATDYIEENTTYIRALNLIVSNKEDIAVLCRYNEEEDFLQMYYGEKNGRFVVCSENFMDFTDKKFANKQIINLKV